MIQIFDTVTQGPASIPFVVGAGLIGVGMVVSATFELAKAFSPGVAPDIPKVMVQGVLCALALVVYVPLAKGVWWATQTIALAIYPDDMAQTLGTSLRTIAKRFGQGQLDLFHPAESAKRVVADSAVSFTALVAQTSALLAHWQLRNVQAGVYNVVFTFGPLLIGLASFGLPTLRIWVMALIEVCSWSITAAVLYYGLAQQLAGYMTTAQTADLFDTSFIDAIDNLVFLSSLMLVVPLVTGRLLGMATLGELGRVMPGNQWVGRVARWVQSAQVTGTRIDPHAAGATVTAPRVSQRRPGD